MPKPLAFEQYLTVRRIVEELESIERGITGHVITDAAVTALRELKLAIEQKPIDLGD